MTGKKFILAAALAVCSAAQAFAQISVKTYTDKDSVSVNDNLTLSVEIQGAANSLPRPHMPSMPNFNVYSSGQSQQISFVNGHVSSMQVYTYMLTPRFVGTAEIGPVTVNFEGKEYSSQPLSITVTPPNAAQAAKQPVHQQPQAQARTRQAQPQRQARQQQPAGKGDVFVTASVSNKNPYVNEQTNLTVRLYLGVSLPGNPQYIPPAAKSFLSEDLPPVRNGEETVAGRSYYYTEIKTALFGASAGKSVIEPGTIRYQTLKREAMDPFSPDFLQQFFASGGAAAQNHEIKTEALTVNVKPLPTEGRPASFKGAVGNFRVSAAADRTELKAGEAINFTVTIEGTGNLKTVTAPDMPDMPDFRVYDTVASLNITKDKDLVQGHKKFITVLVPKNSGKFTIPAITFSFFDPATGKYKEVSTQPIAVTAAQGDASAAQFTYSAGSPAQAVTGLNDDIAYVRPSDHTPALTALARKINAAGKFNFLSLLVLACCLAAGPLKRLDGKFFTPKRRAARVAQDSIARAEKMFEAGQSDEAVGIISDALSDYLSAKLECPVSGFTLKGLLEKISSQNPKVTKDTLSSLETVWRELETLRFAPGSYHEAGAGSEPVSVRARKLVDTLEKELKK